MSSYASAIGEICPKSLCTGIHDLRTSGEA